MYFDRAERPETAADEHVAAGGAMEIGDPVAYLLNPWGFVMFAHNQMAALVTGSPGMWLL